MVSNILYKSGVRKGLIEKYPVTVGFALLMILGTISVQFANVDVLYNWLLVKPETVVATAISGDGFSSFFTNVFRNPLVLLFSLFAHVDFIHLFSCLLFWLFFGSLLERERGSITVAAVFLFSGVFGSLLDLLLIYSHLAYNIVSVPGLFVSGGVFLGSSGAIFGILGALLVYVPRKKFFNFPIGMLELWVSIVGLVLIEFLLIGAHDGVAHVSHITAFVGGLLYAFLESKGVIPNLDGK